MKAVDHLYSLQIAKERKRRLKLKDQNPKTLVCRNLVETGFKSSLIQMPFVETREKKKKKKKRRKKKKTNSHH